MQNLSQYQSLRRQWATASSVSNHCLITALGLAVVLSSSPQAQAQPQKHHLDEEQRTDASEKEGAGWTSSDSFSDLELYLPPLEQSLTTIDLQNTARPSEAFARPTATDEPDLNTLETQQSRSAPSSTVPTAEQSVAQDLEIPQRQNQSILSSDLVSQAPVAPELEELEPTDSEESPAVEEAPELDESTDLDESSEEREYVYGRNGQGRWFIQTGIGIPYNPDESNFYGLAGAGITHFFASGHSINVSLNGLAFSQEGSDSVGINLDVIARWHFIRQRTWSLFVDGGVGILNTTSRVPLIGGSRFNFTPQVGGGASLRIAKKTRLLMGIRWHHISNANLFEPNDGQDAVFGWVGLDLPR